MPTPRRNRERKPGRRPSFRSPKPVILVVCEGRATEPEYISGFQKGCRNPRVNVELADEHGVPRTVVEIAKNLKRDAERKAKNEKDDNLAYDAVWCVFDVDVHPGISDAKQMERDNDIDLAISNPCFELWLLLHFREDPGMQDRHTIQGMLKGFVPGYDKRIVFEMFRLKYPDAEKRAVQLDSLAESVGEPGRNPTTGVYKLLRAIAAGSDQCTEQED